VKWLITVLAVLQIASLLLAAPSQKTRAFLLRISEAEVSMKPTAGPNTIENCLVVTPTGATHLELRRQEFFDGRGTLTTYIGRLSVEELARLRNILEADEIRSLPPFVAPTTPMSVDKWHTVSAEIGRGAERKIGYFEWQGASPANAAAAGKDWSRAAAAMLPLVNWFHSVKGVKGRWTRVANPNSVCGE
jgi:hypothetical protein